MIVCIFGPSCVGKTAIAQRAAAALDLPLRSCGDAVRQMAETFKLPIGQLPDEAHRTVDAATIEWAKERRNGCMVEGRFLDAVFATTELPVIMVELRTDSDCRVERVRVRDHPSTFSLEDLERRDAEDVSFRWRLFGNRGSDIARLVLDTSGQTVDECAQQLQEMIKTADLPWKEPPA